MVTKATKNTVTAVAAALACAAIFIAYGMSLEAVELAVFAIILSCIARIDVETRRIPNALVVAAIALRIAYITAAGLLLGADARALLATSIAGALVIGLGLVAVTILIDRLSGGDNLGGGDIKLFAVVGMFLGVSAGLVALALACVLAVVATVLKTARSKGVGSDARTFAFGPFIACATMAVVILSGPLFSIIH